MPQVIAYYWLDDACTAVPTLHFDVVLDSFFLVDILVNFNIGTFQGAPSSAPNPHPPHTQDT